jgi:threonine dehydrogenase-like Zn-dependent dehydrogenase
MGSESYKKYGLNYITAAVDGDGGVGLCGVIAARRLGAGRIFARGVQAGRMEPAQQFGATDQIASDGDEVIGRMACPPRGRCPSSRCYFRLPVHSPPLSRDWP